MPRSCGAAFGHSGGSRPDPQKTVRSDHSILEFDDIGSVSEHGTQRSVRRALMPFARRTVSGLRLTAAATTSAATAAAPGAAWSCSSTAARAATAGPVRALSRGSHGIGLAARLGVIRPAAVRTRGSAGVAPRISDAAGCVPGSLWVTLHLHGSACPSGCPASISGRGRERKQYEPERRCDDQFVHGIPHILVHPTAL